MRITVNVYTIGVAANLRFSRLRESTT